VVVQVVGQIEGHFSLAQNTTPIKRTAYEQVFQELIAIELRPEITGVLVVLNTIGGDVESGLAIAEGIASLSKPTVSLTLGGAHSMGLAVAVATKRSFITPTSTMTIHPIRWNGPTIGVLQQFEEAQKIQDRLLDFVVNHSKIERASLEAMMLEHGKMLGDFGTILTGEEAVSHHIIDEVGGIGEAVQRLRSMTEER